MARNLAERNIAARRQASENITSAADAYRSMGQQHLENLGQVRSQHEALRQRREDRKAREQDAEQKEAQRRHLSGENQLQRDFQAAQNDKDRELAIDSYMLQAEANIYEQGGTRLDVALEQQRMAYKYGTLEQQQRADDAVDLARVQGKEERKTAGVQAGHRKDEAAALYAHESALWDRRLAGELAVAKQRGVDNRAVAQMHADARELRDNSNIKNPFDLYDRLFEDAMVGSMDKFYTVDPYSGEWVPDLAKYGNSAAEWNAAILEDLEGRRGGIEDAIRGIAQVQKWSAFEIDQFTKFFWSRAAVAQVVNVGPAGSGVPGEAASAAVTDQSDPDAGASGTPADSADEGAGNATDMARETGTPSRFDGRTFRAGQTDQEAFTDAFIDKGETNREPTYRLFDETDEGPRPADNYDEVRSRLENNFGQNLTERESPVAERIWEMLDAMANGTLRKKNGNTYGYDDLPSVDDLTLMARNLREMYADSEEQFSNPNAIIRQMNTRFRDVEGYDPLRQGSTGRRTTR